MTCVPHIVPDAETEIRTTRPDAPGPKIDWRQRLLERIGRMLASRRLKVACVSAAVVATVLSVLFVVFYIQCARKIDRQLESGVFADSVNIYASPLYLSVGDQLNAADLA